MTPACHLSSSATQAKSFRNASPMKSKIRTGGLESHQLCPRTHLSRLSGQRLSGRGCLQIGPHECAVSDRRTESKQCHSTSSTSAVSSPAMPSDRRAASPCVSQPISSSGPRGNIVGGDPGTRHRFWVDDGQIRNQLLLSGPRAQNSLHRTEE